MYIYIYATCSIKAEIVIVSYADDNTPYKCSQKLKDIFETLKNETNNLFDRFENNSFKSNISKCHQVTNLNSPAKVQISNETIMSEYRDKFGLIGL